MQWNVVSTSSYTPVEPPAEPLAVQLRGEKSTIVLPLRWPMSKGLEEQLIGLRWERLVLAFHWLLPGRDDEPKFPASDDELPPITRPDGSPYPLPWQEKDKANTRGETWEWLFRWWYFENDLFTKADLLAAFGDAVEALTGLPLDDAAPSLRLSMPTAPTGRDDSGSTDTSTPTEN